jgi:hypothetical protein
MTFTGPSLISLPPRRPPNIYESAAPVKWELTGIYGLLSWEAVWLDFNWPSACLR